MTPSRVVRSACIAVSIGALLAGAVALPNSAAGAARAPSPLLEILEPADQSQVAADGTLPVRVALANPIKNPATFRATLATGEPPTNIDVTDQFTVANREATATLTSAHLEEGISVLTVSAQPGTGDPGRPPDDGRQYRSVTISWEPEIDLATADRCDIIATSLCLTPYPNDHFTVADPTSGTGRRLNLDIDSMPRNVANVPVNPVDHNRRDGFSPGATIVVHIPELDLGQTGGPPITDMAQSLEDDTPIAVIDAETGEKHLIFAELDARAANPNQRMLIIHPGTSFREGRRYIVALRNLEDSSGASLEAERGFRTYRDQIPTFAPEVEDRRAHFEQVFAELDAAGVERDELFLAWDFTVMSGQNLAGPFLEIRDDAFASLGDDAPAFAVTSVVANPNPGILRRVVGTYTVPKYLTGTGGPGSTFNYPAGAGPDTAPVRNGDFTANFTCLVPTSSIDDPGLAHVWGHGLLGSHTSVNSDANRTFASTQNLVTCGTSWVGLSTEDQPFVLGAIGEMSQFARVADRVQQSFLNQMFLARLMKHEEGLVSHSAFQNDDDEPLIATGDAVFSGQSQGALLGGAATAVSTEWTRAVLTAPSMTAGLVFPRSIYSGPASFGGVIGAAYPGDLQRELWFALHASIWDRLESGGYAQHMTDEPYPNTPAHSVLLQAAFGDHQTTTIAPEVEARTIGARIYQPVLAPGRHTAVVPYLGIPAIDTFPFFGSALVVWDAGNPAPPDTNTFPFPPVFGSDPHGVPAANASAQHQRATFFRTGGVIDVCGGLPCVHP
jgi:hypothetical protein